MSVSRPTVLPDWATGTNYTGGVRSGHPNKSAPSGGLVIEGFDPLAPAGAQNVNYILNNHAAWVNFTDSNALGSNVFIQDDFSNTTLNLSLWSDSGTAGSQTAGNTVTTADFGSLVTNSGNGSRFLQGGILPQSNFDFCFEARVAPIARVASGVFNIGFIDTSGPTYLAFRLSDIAGVWQGVEGVTLHNTGVAAVINTYQVLRLTRISGALTWYVGGVSSATATNSTVGPAYSPYVINTATATGNNFAVDYIKYFVTR